MNHTDFHHNLIHNQLTWHCNPKNKTTLAIEKAIEIHARAREQGVLILNCNPKKETTLDIEKAIEINARVREQVSIQCEE